MAASSQPQSPSPATAQARHSSARAFGAPARQAAAKAAGVATGAKRFGAAVWGPMAHTGGVLWLEITGLFFALFALFFAQNVYKFRQNYTVSGQFHFIFRSWLTFYAAVTLLFAFFAFLNFYKAHQKERKNRARQAR
jgi:hypothetical protein